MRDCFELIDLDSKDLKNGPRFFLLLLLLLWLSFIGRLLID